MTQSDQYKIKCWHFWRRRLDLEFLDYGKKRFCNACREKIVDSKLNETLRGKQ